MDKILNIKVEAAKKGWDWAMNFCNNLCVQISDGYNNDDHIEQADSATECSRKIQSNMGYYPPDIETSEWKQSQHKEVELINALRHLVILKKYKDKYGKDKNYNEQQAAAWVQAIKVLIEINPTDKLTV